MTALAKVKNGTSLPGLSSWMDELLGRDLMSFSSGLMNGLNVPAVNVKETPNEFLLELAAPGLNKDSFNLNLDNGTLTISCENSHEQENDNDRYTRKEFNYTSFHRSFNLPDTVNAEKISAKYLDGILLVTLPKREEARQKPPRTIKIS